MLDIAPSSLMYMIHYISVVWIHFIWTSLAQATGCTELGSCRSVVPGFHFLLRAANNTKLGIQSRVDRLLWQFKFPC